MIWLFHRNWVCRGWSWCIVSVRFAAWQCACFSLPPSARRAVHLGPKSGPSSIASAECLGPVGRPTVPEGTLGCSPVLLPEYASGPLTCLRSGRAFSCHRVSGLKDSQARCPADLTQEARLGSSPMPYNKIARDPTRVSGSAHPLSNAWSQCSPPRRHAPELT